MEDKKRLKKEVDHSRLLGGSFNNQGNLLARFVLADCKVIRSPHLPESYNGIQSCVPSGWPQQHTARSRLHPCILENSFGCGNSECNICSKDRIGVGSLWLTESSSWVNVVGRILSMTSSKMVPLNCILSLSDLTLVGQLNQVQKVQWISKGVNLGNQAILKLTAYVHSSNVPHREFLEWQSIITSVYSVNTVCDVCQWARAGFDVGGTEQKQRTAHPLRCIRVAFLCMGNYQVLVPCQKGSSVRSSVWTSQLWYAFLKGHLVFKIRYFIQGKNQQKLVINGMGEIIEKSGVLGL